MRSRLMVALGCWGATEQLTRSITAPLLRNLICIERVKHFCVFVALNAFIPASASGDEQLQSIAAGSVGVYATASGVSTLNLLFGSHASLLSPQQSDFDACRCEIESHSAGERAKCPPWWQWVPAFAENKKTGMGVDLQALSVLNQSPGGQHSYLSSDVSVNALLREWKLYRCEGISLGNHQAFITLMYEPALGIIRSMHFRDPGDATGRPAQTPNLTIHPLLSAQSDLFNLTIDRKKEEAKEEEEEEEEALVEFKLTVAPQVDFYGRFTGKDAQFQLPLQPNIEWHFKKQVSLVVQVSVPLFTVGGRNPPASFAIGFLWHAVDKLSGDAKEAVGYAGAAER